jgi:hypothetical protein
LDIRVVTLDISANCGGVTCFLSGFGGALGLTGGNGGLCRRFFNRSGRTFLRLGEFLYHDKLRRVFRLRRRLNGKRRRWRRRFGFGLWRRREFRFGNINVDKGKYRGVLLRRYRATFGTHRKKEEYAYVNEYRNTNGNRQQFICSFQKSNPDRGVLLDNQTGVKLLFYRRKSCGNAARVLHSTV